MRRFLAILVLLLAVEGQARTTKNVLILFDDWRDLPPNIIADQQVRKVLGSESDFDVQIFEEYLDETRLGGKGSPAAAAVFFREKYAGIQPDVLIVVGPSALEFGLQYGRGVFPNVPVVFMNVEAQEHGPLPRNVTGVQYHWDWTGTLNLALRLHPGTKHVFLVSGTSDYDRVVHAEARRELQPFESNLDFEDLTDLSLGDLLGQVAHLPEHSIVVYLTLFRDAQGKSFVPSQICPLVSLASNAPVYGVYETAVGKGVVGGSVLNVTKYDARAANIVTRLLRGEPLQNIPVEDGLFSEYMFDWRELHRWRIPESQLPKGSQVLYREVSVWERYKWHILGLIAVLAIQSLLILTLVIERRSRQRAQENLEGRLQFESLLLEISTDFLKLPPEQVELELSQAVGRILRFLRVDRITLFGRGRPADYLELLYSSKAQGIADPPPRLDPKQVPWAIGKLDRGEAVVVTNLDELPSEALRERAFWAESGVKSIVMVPLRTDQGVFGTVACLSLRKERRWPQALVNQLQFVGHVFFNALMRARTERAAREIEQRAEEELHALSGRLITAQEEERSRIARELHDDVNQKLGLLGFALAQLARKSPICADDLNLQLLELWRQTNDLSENVHRLSHNLHSAPLENLGLALALAYMCEEFSCQHKIEVTFAPDGVSPKLPTDVSLCLFRVVQEGLSNVAKHSGAGSARVGLRQTDTDLHLTIEDTGIGFDLDKARGRAALGLVSMRERLRLAKGTIHIQSALGQGTSIEVSVPCKAEKPVPVRHQKFIREAARGAS